MNELKKLHELKQGDCVVVMETPSGKIRKTEGKFERRFGTVFAIMPVSYKVLGYEQ